VFYHFDLQMISVFTLGLALVLGIVAAIFVNPEPATGKSFSAGQMASIVGTFVVLLGLATWF
jgi:hypothetical protein